MKLNLDDRVDFDATGTFAGIDSAVLDADFVSDALDRQNTGKHPNNSLDAAIGIKNAIIAAAVFWGLAFVVYRLLNLLVL
jgi:hypothetical protein